MATLYVDYKNGNDAADGSSGAPLKTLTHTLASHANNGDTILLRGGSAADEIYHETAMTTSKTMLTIAADTGHAPRIYGSLPYSSWSLTAEQSATYETAFTPAACSMVWDGDTYLTKKASIAEVEAAENSWYADVAGDKLYVHVTGGGSPGTLEAGSPSVGLVPSGTGFICRNIEWRHHLRAFTLSGGTALIDACKLWDNYHSSEAATQGLRITSSGVEVRNCVIYQKSGEGISIETGGSAAWIHHNLIQLMQAAVGCGVNIEVGTGHIIEYNYIDTVNDGVDGIGAGTEYIARFNTIRNFTHGGLRTNAAGSSALIHNNVLYIADGFANGYFGLIADTGAYMLAYHNVIHSPTYAKSIGVYLNTNEAGNVVKNNLVLDCNSAYATNAAKTPSYTSDYNAAFGSRNADYVDWTADIHAIALNPMVMDYANHDFRLLSTSPLIDAGALVTGINEGFRGGAPDIGAFEYVRPLRHGRR